MKRREFISAAGTAAVIWPLVARAQQHPQPVVGYLASWSPDAYGQRGVAAFRQGLGNSGFVEGKNLTIELRWAEGHLDRLPALAADLVRRPVSVIATSATSATLAAKAATTTIPIVFSMAADPVALGLVESLARPGSNLTGATQLNVELAPKRLQLLHELIPAATSMALLINPKNAATAETQQRNVDAMARNLGLKLHVLKANGAREVVEAFATARGTGVGGLVISVDGFFTSKFTEIATMALQHQLPTIFSFREFVDAGGLIGYSGSITETHRIVGTYVGRILKGEKASDLPVQQSARTEMFINLKTAKALGIPVPPTLLVRADEVIE